MMTVASRLGTLARLAIELEEKLIDGSATERDTGLLIRLYTKVNDPVSAGEIIEEFLKISGGSRVDALQEKARVYLACTDYHNYESTVRELIELDPDGEGDYLRQLAMSMLERGKPHEARDVLSTLTEVEMGSDSAEFEAGVLALAGLREEAVSAYRRGIVGHPERIESYLLMAALMDELGLKDRAVGMFQHLAEYADKDDLFTIAIDGLLNLEADESVMEWARRVTLERLAHRHDKMYLYQLLSDLAEQTEDYAGMLTALENSLAISGERRPSILRELMDMSRASGDIFSGRSWEGDPERQLAFGRRLVALEQLVPPQVYLDLGEAFLDADDAPNAARTFRRASDLPDYTVFQRQAAGLFEKAGFREEALRTYERVLVSQSTDAGLMAKVGELYEQIGRDDVARGMYGRAVELLVARRPLAASVTEEDDDPLDYWSRNRNIDDWDQHYDRILKGMLVTTPDAAEVEALLREERVALDADVADARAELPDGETSLGELARYPRIMRRAQLLRRLAVAFKRPELADELDLTLLETFADDEELLLELCQFRVRWGYVGSARRLLEASTRPEEQKHEVSFLVGEGMQSAAAQSMPVGEATGLLLPLLAQGKTDDVSVLVRRVDFGAIEEQELQALEPLFSAAAYLGDQDLTLLVGREWMRLHVKFGTGSYQVEPILTRCRQALDDDRYRSLVDFLVGRILEDPQAAQNFLTMLPTLQEQFEESLVDEEQVLSLLDNYGEDGWGWGLGPVLVLLPEGDRGGALRSVWPKIQKTNQAYFLVTMVQQATVELGDDLAKFIVETMPSTFAESDDSWRYWTGELADQMENAPLKIGMLDAMIEHDGDFLVARSSRAVLLDEVGRTEEAIAAAIETYERLSEKDIESDWELRMASDRILDRFLPDHTDAFLAALDREEEDRGPSLEIEKQRLGLIAKQEDAELSFQALQAALEKLPDELELLQRLRNHYSSKGMGLESLRVLERMLELEEDDAKKEQKKGQLLAAWQGLKNPVEALAVKRTMKPEDEDDGAWDPTAFGLPPGFVLAPGSTITISGPNGIQTITGGEKPDEDRPTIEKVKEALEEDDVESARTTFRRLWRKFKKGEDGGSRSSIFYFFGGSSAQNIVWPEDEEDDDAEDDDEPPPRGGLDSFDPEEPEEPEERRSAYEVLAEHDFGVDEMQRMLRIKSYRELDGMGTVFAGLLHGRRHRIGDEQALAELLETVRAGRAGKEEYALLLGLLDETPETSTADAEEILAELVQTLNPMDAPQLRKLARVYARIGSREQAVRLYRWCATRTDSSYRFYFGNAPPTINTRDLVKEVKETLEGDDRVAILEAILAFSEPAETYPWQRQNYETLVMQTWDDLLGAEEALARCRELALSTADLSKGLRRGSAKEAAWLFARSGELEEALRCMEIALCKVDPELLPADQRRWGGAEYPGYLGHNDLRRFLPLDAGEWEGAADWYRAFAAALEGWLGEERVNESNVSQALALTAVRLHEAGDGETARAVVARLREREDLATHELLWVADAARECGSKELADSIELELFEDRRLHIERVPEVVARALEEEGAERALELGAQAAEYTLHEDLLGTLVAAAETSGDADGAESWRTRLAAAEAALAELEAEDEGEGEGDETEEEPAG